jgi:cAMP phosphodiesterase
MAIDPGVHLSGIIRILEGTLPAGNASRFITEASQTAGADRAPASSNIMTPVGVSEDINTEQSINERIARMPHLTQNPFFDLQLPHTSPTANATYITRELVSTYLITHPHLDHISGFIVNTAAFQQTSRPKKVAALPHVIEALKTHIFNDVIWPNLSDEDGGVGLVSFMRLGEGGNVALGQGESQGYVEVCEGLTVKSWGISHGHCMAPRHKHHAHSTNSVRVAVSAVAEVVEIPASESTCVVDSTAFFVRDEESGREVLVFGDVEPDSLSMRPRTEKVWSDAAAKVAKGTLAAIFIECSYDDSRSDETLFGHLAPRHLIAELSTFAGKVSGLKENGSAMEVNHSNPLSPTKLKRRRRDSSIGIKVAGSPPRRANSPQNSQDDSHDNVSMTNSAQTPVPPNTSTIPSSSSGRARKVSTVSIATSNGKHSRTPSPTVVPTIAVMGDKDQLAGVQVFIIHVKDTLGEGTYVGNTILEQLREQGEAAGLGCTFSVAEAGESIFL